MHFIHLALLASMVAAAPKPNPDMFQCNSGAPSAHLEQMYQAHLANNTVKIDAVGQRTIYVHAHIVESYAKQYTTTITQVYDQIDVMNNAFSSWGVFFQLIGDVGRNINDEWAKSSPGTQAELNMRKALQVPAGYANINLYYLSDIGFETSEPGLLGFCRFPAPYTRQVGLLDGCLQSVNTLPNGNATHYNLGYTTVHELGHWFGLRHVFSDEQPGTCFGPGDYVTDTAPQRELTAGCPFFKDTCPDHPGYDNIHNYMDYSDNYCMTKFTTGQIERGLTMYDQYRAGRNIGF